MSITNFNFKQLLDVSGRTTILLMALFFILYGVFSFDLFFQSYSDFTLKNIFKTSFIYMFLLGWAGVNFFLSSFVSYFIIVLLFMKVANFFRLFACILLGLVWATLLRKFNEIFFPESYIYMFILLGFLGGLIGFYYTNELKSKNTV